MPDTTWHHVATVSDGAAQRMYIDGALMASTSGKPNPGSGASALPFQLGGNQSDPSRWSFGGNVGPWRVSSTARYAVPFAPEWGWTADGNTFAVWNLTEGSGSTAADSASRGLHMTLYGGTWATVECPA